MAQAYTSIDPFIVRDCAFAAIATGERAVRLDEFRDKLERTPIGCIYYHFWGALLHTRFAHPDHHNDFSAWAHFGLHDSILSERLNIIDPTEYSDLEKLRKELLEIVEERLDEVEAVPVAAKDHSFHFIRSKTIIFETKHQIYHPSEFIQVLPLLSTSSIFFHFIEAKRREPKYIDDFSHWLMQFGEEYTDLIDALKEIDPFFLSLADLRNEILQTFSVYFKNRPTDNLISKDKE